MASDIFVSYFLEEGQQNFFSFGSATPQPVDGLSKLLVVWLKALFTDLGSDIYDTEYGSLLPRMIDGGVVDLEDAHDLTTMAVEQASESIRRIQSHATLLQSERLGSVRLLGIENSGTDGIAVRIKLENALGESLIAEMPIG